MSDSENSPKSTAADAARDAVEQIKRRNRLGPDDQEALDAAITAMVNGAVATALRDERVRHVAELREFTASQDTNIKALEFMIAMQEWQQEHLRALSEGVLANGERVLEPLKSNLELTKAMQRLATQAYRVDGTESERLDALLQAVFETFTPYLAIASEQDTSGSEVDYKAMTNAARALLKVLSLDAGTESAGEPKD